MTIAPFTVEQIRQILDDSENATTLDGKHHGHARSRHVVISKTRLHGRLAGGTVTHRGIPMFTRFLTAAEQDRVVALALNTPSLQPLLEDFYVNKRAAVEIKDILINTAVQVEMAVTGGKRTALFDASYVTVRLHWHPRRVRSLHISSAFAAAGVLGG